MSTYAVYPPSRTGGGGGGGGGVTSLNSLTGAVILAAGTGITITPSGNTLTIASTASGGTVTSVALADGSTTPIYGISGSPVTTSGTLTFSLITQTANKVFAGPTTGAAAAPTFRALVAADFPTLPYISTTLGATATSGGLTVSGNTLSAAQATTSTNGWLSSADWNTFSGKGSGSVTSVAMTVPSFLSIAGSPITTSGTLAVGLSGTALPVANGGTGVTSLGNFTDAGTDGIVVTGGTGAVITSMSIAQTKADGTHNGYLSSGDWTTFNGKGSGSVTSVAMTVPAFLSVAGSPITTSGTLAVSLSGTALPVANGGTGVTSVTTAPTATAFAGWDANSNMSANRFSAGYTTTATAAGTTTLTVSSAQQQYFTGSTTQTVVMPVTSTMVLGSSFTITNNSSGNLTVNSSGGNLIQTMTANTKLVLTVISTSLTTAAAWDAWYTLETDSTTVTALSAIGASPNANAATITGNTLNLQPANGSFGGVVTTGTQTFAGSKSIGSNASDVITIGAASSTAINQDNGGVNVTTRTITANLTIDTTTTDYIIFLNNSGAITVTLPTPTNGRLLHLKDITGAQQTNNVTLARHASEKIEGIAASYTLQSNWGNKTITSNGTDWFFL